MARRFTIASALILGWLCAGGAAAQTPPLACTAQNLNAMVCQAEGRCRCDYNAGGLMIRAAPGYFWNCDLLFGTCMAGEPMPALLRTPLPLAGPTGMPLPGRPADVRAVQQALAQRGFDPGPIDGVAGPRTRAALIAFQRANSMPANGNITPEVARRLGM